MNKNLVMELEEIERILETKVEILWNNDDEEKIMVTYLKGSRIYTLADILGLSWKDLKRIYGIGIKRSRKIVDDIQKRFGIVIEYKKRIDVEHYKLTGEVIYGNK